MKKILLSGSLALLLLPALALAANFNDVTLTTDAILDVGGITLNVSGSSAVVNSITVSGSDVNVILGPGSSIAVNAPSFNQMAISGDTSNDLVNQTCTASASTVTFSAATSVATSTITITPSSSTCPVSGAVSSSSGVSNGPVASGGGGGGGSYVAPTQPGTTPIVQTTAPGTSATSALQAQVQALMAQISALTGGSGFKRNLTVGSTGADVKALQIWLNAKGYIVTSSGAGSPGKETTKFGGLTRAALAKFQKANGITPPAGYFGAKTRAYIAAHP